MLRLEESLQLFLQELTLIKQLLDAFGSDLPAFKDARILIMKLAIALFKFVVFVVHLRRL